MPAPIIFPFPSQGKAGMGLLFRRTGVHRPRAILKVDIENIQVNIEIMFKRWLQFDSDTSILLIGPRRAGKTTLVKSAFPDHRYATLDDIDNLDWASRDPKGFIASLGSRGIIDEIQRVPALTVAVKYAIDNHGARFIMTGSSSLRLLDAAADSLAGRIDIMSLPTACWGEQGGVSTHDILSGDLPLPRLREADRKLKSAMDVGQFPEILTASDDTEARKLLTRYKNSYFTRDMMQMANLANAEGLRAILHNLVRSLGSHLEVSHFAREAGLSHATAKKYLATLAQAQLTFRLLGYQYGPAKRYLKASKTYLCDNGVISALGGSASRGQLLENFVIAELEKRRKLGLIACDQLYFYQSAGGREVDVVFENRGLLYAVEIKNTRRPGAKDMLGLKSFARDMDREVKCVLFYTGTERACENDVELVPVAALYRGGSL